MADVSGVGALERFLKRCAHGTSVILAETPPRTRAALARMGNLDRSGVTEARTWRDALARASGGKNLSADAGAAE